VLFAATVLLSIVLLFAPPKKALIASRAARIVMAHPA
jgi:hypothetical protein